MFLIKNDSWHFRFATMFNCEFRVTHRTNATLCSYARFVMSGMFWFSLFTFLGASGVIGIIMLTLGLIQHGVFDPTGNWFVLIGTCSVFLAVLLTSGYLFSRLSDLYSDWRERRERLRYMTNKIKPYEPSIVALAWEGVKGKFCPTLTFEAVKDDYVVND